MRKKYTQSPESRKKYVDKRLKKEHQERLIARQKRIAKKAAKLKLQGRTKTKRRQIPPTGWVPRKGDNQLFDWGRSYPTTAGIDSLVIDNQVPFNLNIMLKM